MPVLFPKGAAFEAAAVRSDLFQSMDQVDQAAAALERAGLLERAGDGTLVAARDITDADLAFVVSAEQQRREAE